MAVTPASRAKSEPQAPERSEAREEKKTNGSGKAPPVPAFSKEQELAAYRDMLLIRRFEEKAGQLYGMGLIGGFCHLYIGQEAVVVGMQMASKEDDQVITGYRDHGHMLACGMDPKGVMAELTGRSGGYSKGKGGSMHMFSKEKHFYGGHGIVGAQVSLGTGLAFANHYRGNQNVWLTYFGDGAANQGQVYESFNMAELWKLPVVYIIENNRYAMGTSVDALLGRRPISPSAALSFNIPGEQVDGMDVRAVKAAGDKAIAMVPRRQGSVYPGNADLSLSRTFDVRSGEIPDERRSAEDARRARSDRAGAHAPSEEQSGERRRAEADRRQDTRRRRRGGGIRHARSRARSQPNCGRTSTADLPIAFAQRFDGSSHADAHSDARAVADDGGGQARQMAEERRRQIKSGDVLAEIETDKATMEVEAVDEGTLAKSSSPKAPTT